jgi:hypothetical protein
MVLEIGQENLCITCGVGSSADLGLQRPKVLAEMRERWEDDREK